VNAPFADARALARAVTRAIDALAARSLARLRELEEQPAAALPSALTLAASLPLALLVGVPTAGVGIGVALGVLIAMAVTLRTRALARRDAEVLAVAIADARADADHRVMIVTRQYEWAVNDVANLRDALQRARAQQSPLSPLRAEPLAPRAEPPARIDPRRDTVRLVRYVRESDPSATLRFGADGGVRPEQVRLVGGGHVVGISARSLADGTGADTTFAIQVSDELAEAIAKGRASIAVEALVDERWLLADVRSAVTQEAEVRDKRGRVWRTAASEEAALL